MCLRSGQHSTRPGEVRAVTVNLTEPIFNIELLSVKSETESKENKEDKTTPDNRASQRMRWICSSALPESITWRTASAALFKES